MGVLTVPIHQVLEDGSLRRLGHWLHAERRLELEVNGFPLLGVGSHSVEGDLPWLFWDMCPSGFLGKRFARLEAGLALNSDPRTWSRDDALLALTEAGDDLPGNLIIGEHSLERWQTSRAREAAWEVEADRFYRGEVNEAPGFVLRPDGSVVVGPRPWDPPLEIDAWLSSGSSEASNSNSSLGGERPKLVTRTPHGGSLLKFSPPVPPPTTQRWNSRRPAFEALPGFSFPVGTPQGQRWADLLRVEAHCAQTLHDNSVDSAKAGAVYSLTGRVVLEVVRFDRLGNWGRRGASTLYWYAMARLGDVNVPAPRVVAALVEDGHLPASALPLVERVHAFSAAIANTDAHLGNYGLVFDENGRASLAPFYDILPMALAPSNDELPDARLRPSRPPVDSVVETWVNDLVRRVSADDEISTPFRELWLRVIGR